MYIETNHNLEELRLHGTPGFPFEVCYVNYVDYPNRTVSNHWHAELEISYVVQGSVMTRINGTESLLHAGEAVFVNSNAFHMTQAVSTDTPAILYSIIFAPQFLASVTSDIFQKYVSPYIYNTSCSCIWLQDFHDPKKKDIMSFIKYIIQLDEEKKDTYELQIHTALCQVWQQLISFESGYKGNELNSIQLERMRDMLTYLQLNYTESITINEIADAANISRSECFRCFQKVLRQKPFEYLINFRLEQAANLLLSSTKSISDIASSCGINHQSYFGQLFKEKYGCTPSEYRTKLSKFN